MSYRNPHIIVDRSAEIWTQGVAKSFEALERGVTNYFQAKKMASEKKNKKDEATNRYLISTQLEYDKKAVTGTSAIKNNMFRDQIYKNIVPLGEIAVKNQTALAMNPNQDPQTIKQQRKSISDYQQYLNNSKRSANLITTNANEFYNVPVDEVVSGYAPSTGDELSNLTAVNAVNGLSTPGVTSDVTITRNEDNSNTLVINSKMKVGSVNYNKYKEAGLLDDKTLYPEKDGYINIRFERNLNTWDGTFFDKIPVETDREQALKEAGVKGKNGAITKDYIYNNLTTRTEGGFKYTEQVVDWEFLNNNVAYQDMLTSQAKGIMAYDMKQQKDFIKGRLKWGSDVADRYEKTDSSKRLDFLKSQLMMKDLSALGKRRDVTDEDIKSNVIPGLTKYEKDESGKDKLDADGNKIPNSIYTINYGRPRAVTPTPPPGINEEINIAKDYLQSFFKDPVSFLEKRFSVGEEDSVYKEFSFKDGLITLRPADKEYKVGTGKDATIEVEEQEEQSFPIKSAKGQRLLQRILTSQELGTDKQSREILRLINKVYPIGSKTGFQDALKSLQQGLPIF